MGIEDLLKELEQKRHQFLQMGGPDKVKRQHDKGRPKGENHLIMSCLLR